jgi:hypothetical protein
VDGYVDVAGSAPALSAVEVDVAAIVEPRRNGVRQAGEHAILQAPSGCVVDPDGEHSLHGGVVNELVVVLTTVRTYPQKGTGERGRVDGGVQGASLPHGAFVEHIDLVVVHGPFYQPARACEQVPAQARKYSAVGNTAAKAIVGEYLCIGCLGRRPERQLTAACFPAIPPNSLGLELSHHGPTGRAVPVDRLTAAHLAWLSSWNCLCGRPVFGAVGPCRTVRAVHHDGNMSAVQWGTVSTWVAAVGTVAAVSLALWGARGERKERLRRELRQQAVRISAWFVEMHKDSHGEDSHGEDPRREAWLPPELRGRAADVELLNNSADPVTDVLVFLSRVSYKVQRWWDQEPEYRVMIGVLPPGRWTISVPKSGGAIVDVKLGGSPAMSRVMVIISFTDNAGNHWARGARGELRQLPTPAIEYWKVPKEDIDWRVPTRLD